MLKEIDYIAQLVQDVKYDEALFELGKLYGRFKAEKIIEVVEEKNDESKLSDLDMLLEIDAHKTVILSNGKIRVAGYPIEQSQIEEIYNETVNDNN